VTATRDTLTAIELSLELLARRAPADDEED
jgi:hypothetical protein